MRRLASIALAMLFSAISLCATDLTITFQVETKSFLGGKTTSETHYYTPKYQLIRNEHAKTDQLVDYGKAITYAIDHDKKQISMVRMEDALEVLESMDKRGPNPVSRMLASMGGDPDEFTVETEGTEVVAEHPCTIHKITVGNMVMRLSVDPNLSSPISSADYAKMMRVQAASMAKAGSAALFRRLYEEMGKIKGIPLKTQMSGFRGVTSANTEAIEIKQGPISVSLFALPNYPIEDLGKKMKEQVAQPAK